MGQKSHSLYINYPLLKTTICLGAVHKRHRQLGGGKGSQIGQICRRIVLKTADMGEEGVKYPEKIAVIIYGWSLTRPFVSKFCTISDMRWHRLCYPVSYVIPTSMTTNHLGSRFCSKDYNKTITGF